MRQPQAYWDASWGRTVPVPVIHEPEEPYEPAAKPRLLDQVRHAIRARHYSYRTEEAYVGWIRRYILYHGKRHPTEMGKPEIEQFLTALAVERRVSASTQNQALASILFLYQHVLHSEPGWLDGIVRARRPERLPVVLTRGEVSALLANLRGVPWIVSTLLYGSGLRLFECLGLRVKDVEFDRNEILVREGKGKKDRVTMLPRQVKQPLAAHLERVRAQHGRDLEAGFGRVPLPGARASKYPNADREWAWQWVFPASRISPALNFRPRPPLGADAAPASPPRVGHPEGDPRGGAPGTGHQAGGTAHIAPLLRDPPARGRLRHPHRTGVARASRREDHDDLHARAQPRWPRRREPGRPFDAGNRGGR